MEKKTIGIPDSEANQQWLRNVQGSSLPATNHRGRYNLVVIGGGPAGLVTAAGAAGLGAKVALIESDKMGGDCLNSGCVPSKSLIRSAKDHHALAHRFRDHGIHQAETDFGSIVNKLQQTRATLSHHDSVDRFRELGVDVFLGHGVFTSPESIEVNQTKIRFKKAVIATGAKSTPLTIAGGESVELLTNETLFNLRERPSRLIVIGGGAIGCEMAQAFARLGTSVVQVEKSGQLLGNEDAEASAILYKSLKEDGVKILLNASVRSVAEVNGEKQVDIVCQGSEQIETADQILVCVGRSSNVHNLGLEKANVTYDERSGIQVNDFLQTSNRNIFAAGDVTNLERFTHAADFMARIVIQNALFMGRRRYSSLVIPRCTYTTPEVAHVGVTARAVAKNPDHYISLTVPFTQVDRSIIDGENQGFVRVHLKRGSDQILGATIVNPCAGELISHLTLAMTNQIGLRQIASTIFPYPTRADAIRKLGDQYNRSRLTPLIRNIFAKWLTWIR